MMDQRAESVEWLRNHIAVHDPEPGRWVPIDILLPLMARVPWPEEPWVEPDPWEPLVYSMDVEAGNYHVEVTARQQLPGYWVITLVMAVDWSDQYLHEAWTATSLDQVVDDLVGWVDRVLMPAAYTYGSRP
jgi:hypothetical protein